MNSVENYIRVVYVLNQVKAVRVQPLTAHQVTILYYLFPLRSECSLTQISNQISLLLGYRICLSVVYDNLARLRALKYVSYSKTAYNSFMGRSNYLITLAGKRFILDLEQRAQKLTT